jgi:potassium efflux system protein
MAAEFWKKGEVFGSVCRACKVLPLSCKPFSDSALISYRYPAIFILLLLAPLLGASMAFGQGNEASDAVKKGALLDTLVEEINLESILLRLEISEGKIRLVEDKIVRAQWVHITQLLQMQIERLDTLEGDFSLGIIEHPPEGPPFPLSYLDQLRHKYRGYQDVHAQLEKAYRAADKRIEAAQSTYVSAKQKLETLKEEGSTADVKAGAEVDYQLARESFVYARLDARLINRRLKQASNNLAHIGKIIPEIEEHIIFSEQDYQLQLQNILKRETQLKNSLNKTRVELWQELSKPRDQRVYIESLESLQVLLSEALSYSHYENEIWEERQQVYRGATDTETAVQWREENTFKRSEISELVRVKMLSQKNHTKLLIDLENRESTAPAPLNIELQKEMLMRRQFAFDNLETGMELLDDHLSDLRRISHVETFNYLKEKTLYVFNSFWNLQLAVVQDRSITTGKGVTAILLFIAGLMIARLFILRLLYTLLKLIGIREGIAYTITQLLFYLALFALLFGAISYSGIPLHIFAFFGGALAIATGFGSQKIVSSFLSGVVLLMEGSIRVGDMVQVDDSKGRVKSIGMRHTQMTTFNNVDILIPNAKFLEENVINWTLESELIRSDINVSINYSAPVETVIEILEQLANDHSHVLNEPAPEAFLETINCDHGYLRFTLYYWHQMPSPREHLIINSELQIEMIERFNHQGIRLASPTQDIIMHRGLAAA